MPDSLKKIIFLILSLFAFILVVLIVIFSLKPSLEITTNPKESRIIINNKTYSSGANIPLSSGNYNILVYSNNYKRTEKTIVVKSFGKTKLNIDLKPLKPLIESVPKDNSEEGFVITGSYNDFQEPNYTVTYFDSVSKLKALRWLAGEGVNANNSIISLVQDGD